MRAVKPEAERAVTDSPPKNGRKFRVARDEVKGGMEGVKNRNDSRSVRTEPDAHRDRSVIRTSDETREENTDPQDINGTTVAEGPNRVPTHPIRLLLSVQNRVGRAFCRVPPVPGDDVHRDESTPQNPHRISLPARTHDVYHSDPRRQLFSTSILSPDGYISCPATTHIQTDNYYKQKNCF